MCEADRLYRDNISRHIIIHPPSETNSQLNILDHKAKKAMTKSVKEETLLNWNDKVKKLTIQGDFINTVKLYPSI